MSTNTLISSTMMARRLTTMLYPPEVDLEAIEPVRIVASGPDGITDGWSTWFRHQGRYAEVSYSMRDLSLTMDEFAERRLQAAARLLLG
jgi:hypothetical protein